jgi:hypothetical protein
MLFNGQKNSGEEIDEEKLRKFSKLDEIIITDFK